MTNQQIVALLVSVSFGAGVNVYATVATLGLLGRAGVVDLPGTLDPITNWWIIGASLALFAIEFFLDKVPYIDLVWNLLQTFVRVPVGAVIAWAATSQLGPEWQAAAAAAGGLIALVAHGGKLAVRTAVTPSPEPISNIGLSLAEDGFVVALTWFATQHPYLAAALVAAMLVTAVVMVRWIVRAVTLMVREARERRRLQFTS